MATTLVSASGTFDIGGDITVNRLGFGAMQLTGRGVWGDPSDPDQAIRVLCHLSLRHLGLERIDLYQLHRIDPKVPVAEQLGVLAELQREGLIRHIGLSEVSVDELREAQGHAIIVTVQNLYNLADRRSEPLLEHCTEHEIGFIPWFPLATGELAGEGGPIAGIAAAQHATPSQLALAWLLRRSPVMLPIPGTSSVAHLEENLAAASVQLTDDQFEALAGATA